MSAATAFPNPDRSSFVDRPFACPPDTVLDLPYPPSVNRMWRVSKKGAGVTLSQEYRDWKDNADRLVMATRGLVGQPRINGSFEAQIILQDSKDPARQRGDLDNRIKAVFDYAQRVELIANDKFCERLVVEWGHAPHGCRLILRAVAV